IMQRLFRQIPIFSTTATGGRDDGTFDQIVAASDPNLLTHRIRISLGTSPSTISWTSGDMIVPSISLDGLVIENRVSGSVFNSNLYRVTALPDGTTTRISVASASSLSSTNTYNLYISVFT